MLITYISWFGSPEFVYFSLILIYIFKSKFLALHYSVVISVMYFFVFYMKLIIRHPRPYQQVKEVVPTRCSVTFGDPSAHCIVSSTMLITHYLNLVYHRWRQKKRNEDS